MPTRRAYHDWQRSDRSTRGSTTSARSDRVVVSLMVACRRLLVLWLVGVPAIGSVLLSFTNWDGIGPISSAKTVGLQNYKDVLTIYPPFMPGAAAQPDLARGDVLHRHPDRDVPRGAARPGGAWFAGLPDRDLPPGRAVAGPRRLHLAAHLQPRPGPHQPDHRWHASTGTATSATTSGPPCSPRAGGTSATSCCSTWPA